MKKILIIEDDPAIHYGLQEMMKFENYDIINCSDGEEGTETALEKIPDLIILDINLPSLNGFDVCRKLREGNYFNPIIMLTSRNESIDKIVGLELGADDYITKPFDSRELLARIHSQLRKVDRLRFEANAAKKIKGEEPKRRLLAIMFTDIKDYSKKMNTNEDLALKLLKIHNKIIKESIAAHQGKVVEIIGDAFVVTFKSVVMSVKCAYDIQQKFKLHNKTKPSIEQILIRIGIHLGDVIEYKDNIKGDSVNIAARVQQNAKPGAAALSESVYRAVKNKVNFKFTFLGEYSFKNISEPVNLYNMDL